MATDVRGAATTHQIVRLKPGRHASPQDGACVVEVASLLAGERFSDQPRSVCPVVACYMRTVNDCVGDELLQELYPYAAAIVGTRGPRALRRERARLCASWCRALGETTGLTSELLGRWGGQRAAMICARAALRHGGPSLALAMADTLITCDVRARRRDFEPAPGEGAYLSRRSSPSATPLSR